MANTHTVLHKRSSVLEGEEPKAPSNNALNYGEIAINYAAGHETLFTKNSNDEIVGVSINGNVQKILQALTDHANRNDNPHSVTKEQIGLGNVTNTADADKPVSGPQQAALNLKSDITSIVDNLTTSDANKPLSAKQGVVLYNQLKSVTSGATADITSLLNRVSNLENSETIADTIIARENEIIADFAE